ncbi:cation:proton antiporter domain-containing protein [Neobacillus jeddahensis]|uniref:cation:proton antiporter domain-containing protein n=1 Tax=Neobacillus jeddahensis TaxID=1461580 RepID=UPI000A585D77|nr:cation:proton antiporter [Neobacillus jeddahensis]
MDKFNVCIRNFSVMNAATSFLLLSLGGVVLGAVISFLKILLMRWLRQLGLENTTSYMLMEILLPFLIFMIAEYIGVNGILAVVTGGIVHSFSYKRLNPEIAQLNLLSKNTWSMITFSLNGLVFILLGTQLPEVMHTIWENEQFLKGTLLLYIFGITALILLLRFLWVLCFPNFKLESSETRKSHMKNIFLYTISVLRGTITLVSTLSLPFILGNGETFVERDLLIFIAAGVIVMTMLLANFTLPCLRLRKKRKKSLSIIRLKYIYYEKSLDSY